MGMGKIKKLQLFLFGYIVFLLPFAACGQSPAAYRTVWEEEKQDYPLLIFLHGWNFAGDSSGKTAADL